MSSVYCLLYAYFFLGFLFNSEDSGDMFLQNVYWLSPDYIALHPKRQGSLNCLLLLLWYRRKSKVSSAIDKFLFLLSTHYNQADLLVMNISVTWMLTHIQISHYSETAHKDGAYCPRDSAECSVAEWYLTFLWKYLLLLHLAAIKSIYLQSGRQCQHSNKKLFSLVLCFIIGITIISFSLITHSKYTTFWPKLHNASKTGSRS
jgi:hypothetical protein